MFLEPFAFLCSLVFLILPGYLALRATKLKVGKSALLSISVILSVLLSTYFIYWISVAIGYSKGSIFLFFLVTLLFAYFVIKKKDLSWKKFRKK